ncbi:MAG: TonB-dependent receptor [Burkholderiales bacterium]|nr:TonB-dependent receptor [Burkholderiales bacterium]
MAGLFLAGVVSAQEVKPTAPPEPVATPESAPTPRKPDPPIERIEVRDPASPYNARREETTTKIVVPASEFVKYGDSQLAEVLKRQPGITVRGNEVQMRGLGGGYVQFLIDGQRPPPGWSLDQLPPSQVERIEIIRAATADMSTASIAGTINFVLKRQTSKPSREWRAGFRQGYGYRVGSTSLQWSDQVEDFSYTMNGDLYDSRIEFPGTTEQSRTDAAGRLTSLYVVDGTYPGTVQRAVLTPRLKWELRGGDSLAWNSSLSVANGTFEPSFTGQQVTGTPLTVVSGNGNGTRHRTIVTTDANWITTLDQGTRFDLKAALTDARRRREDSERGFSATGALTQDWHTALREHSRTFSTQGKFSATEPSDHAWQAGWDIGLDDHRDREIRRELPTTISSLVVSELEAHSEVTRIAAFVQNDWKLRPNWSAYAGVRWESVATDVRVESGATTRNRYAVWSPLFQTVWKFTDNSNRQIRLALTRTFKAPDTLDLSPRTTSRANNNSPIDPDYGGNPALKPELSTGVDLALEKYWDPGGNISLTLSFRQIRDLINRSVILREMRWINLPVNEGDADVASLEFDTKLQLKALWKDAPPLDLRASLGVNRSKVKSIPGPNNRLASQTPLSASLGADYRLKGGQLVAGGSIAYRGAGEVRNAVDRFSTGKARRDVDIYVMWKIDPRTTLRLTLADILREKSIEELRVLDAAGTLRQVSVAPIRLQARVNLEMKF